MKRRSFLQASLATACSAAAAVAGAAEPQGQPLYELRTYSLEGRQATPPRSLPEQGVPARPEALRHRSGGRVRGERRARTHVKVYVLIVYPSAEQVATLSARLAADEEYRKAAKDYLAAPATRPGLQPHRKLAAGRPSRACRSWRSRTPPSRAC